MGQGPESADLEPAVQLTVGRRGADPVPVLDDVHPTLAVQILEADLAGPDVGDADRVAGLLEAQIAVHAGLEVGEASQRLADRHGRDGGLGGAPDQQQRGADGGTDGEGHERLRISVATRPQPPAPDHLRFGNAVPYSNTD